MVLNRRLPALAVIRTTAAVRRKAVRAIHQKSATKRVVAGQRNDRYPLSRLFANQVDPVTDRAPPPFTRSTRKNPSLAMER